MASIFQMRGGYVRVAWQEQSGKVQVAWIGSDSPEALQHAVDRERARGAEAQLRVEASPQPRPKASTVEEAGASGSEGTAQGDRRRGGARLVLEEEDDDQEK
ncbi:MAG: hypothetical protein WCJ30_12245 [Deltaproteobacteria bacterium]